jgi:hypothetical protein
VISHKPCSVLRLSVILGLYFLGLALSRPQVGVGEGDACPPWCRERGGKRAAGPRAAGGGHGAGRATRPGRRVRHARGACRAAVVDIPAEASKTRGGRWATGAAQGVREGLTEGPTKGIAEDRAGADERAGFAIDDRPGSSGAHGRSTENDQLCCGAVTVIYTAFVIHTPL